jgi:hypothetical protein
MLIKNVVERPLRLALDTRVVTLEPGEEAVVSAVEVRDAVLRENLQVRTIAIVRPATAAEDGVEEG